MLFMPKSKSITPYNCKIALFGQFEKIIYQMFGEFKFSNGIKNEIIIGFLTLLIIVANIQ